MRTELQYYTGYKKEKPEPNHPKRLLRFVILWAMASLAILCTPQSSLAGSRKSIAVEASPIDIKIRAVYQAEDGSIKPLTDGSVLRSDQNYALAFKTSDQAFVYVIQVDGTGQVAGLFPNKGFKHHKNPVAPNKWHWIPQKDKWVFLDDTLGQEKIYVAVSRKPDEKLEHLLQELIKVVGNSARIHKSHQIKQLMETRSLVRIKQMKIPSVYYGERVFDAADRVVIATQADVYHTIHFQHR